MIFKLIERKLIDTICVTVNKKNIWFKLRYFIFSFLCMLHLDYIAKIFDIPKKSISNVYYENENIKFRTILYGNLLDIKRKINDIKKYDIDYFVKIYNDSEIILKNIYFIDSENNKMDYKSIIEEYIEYECSIKISDIIDDTIKFLSIEYYKDFKLHKKNIDISEIRELLIGDIFFIVN